MINNTIKVAVFIFVSILCLPQVSEGQVQYLDRTQMLDDLLYLKKVLTEIHPAIDGVDEYKILNDEINRIQKTIPLKATKFSFFRLISPILNKIECGHTVIYPITGKRFDLKKFIPSKPIRTFPLKLIEIGNKIVVAESYKGNDGKIIVNKGCLITAINNVNIDTIITDLILFHGGSDDLDKNIQRKVAIKKFSSRYYLLFGKQSKFEVEIHDNNLTTNKIVILEAKAQSKKNITNNTINLEVNKKQNLGILRIKSFSGYDKYHLIYGVKLRQAFREIRNNNIQKLIIDIQDNSGGAIKNLRRLLKYVLQEEFQVVKKNKIKRSSYSKLGLEKINFILKNKKFESKYISLNKYNRQIKPFKKNNYSGELIVLINGRTFSASTIFGAVIKSKSRGKLIGTKSGGGYHKIYGGYYKTIRLKSGISLRIPLTTFELAVKEEVQPKNTSLTPDINIPLEYDSFMLGIDLRLNKSYELFNIENK